MARATRQVLLKTALVVTLGGLVGYAFDGFWVGVSAALAVYLVAQLRHLVVLRAWAESPKRVELPEPGGIWGELYEHLLDLQRSNRKRKKKLAAILAEFQASTEALPDGAVVLGPAGDIVWFNGSAQALLGLRLPQDVGLRVATLVRHPDFTEFFEREDSKGEVEIPSPINRTVTLSLRVIPYGNGQRLMIIRDVSDLHRLAAARRDFVANASHELRTPLTVLRGYLEMMEPESKGAGALATWHGPLGEMRAQAARMESLIADMLKLARLESGAIQTKQDVLDVPQLIERAMDEARTLSRHKHRIEGQVDAGLMLFGREAEMQSVIGNLLQNAVHYTPAGGAITVRWWGDDDGAHFTVRDTGIGIAEKDIPRITERFYRVDVGRSRASGGTGLGLSIVRHALDHHEARLQILSAVGAGSEFLCHFPSHRLQRRAALAVNA